MSTQPSRAIASDCETLVKEIMNPAVQVDKLKKIAAADSATEKIFKLKNTIWNKVISTSDFEHFNDVEYFKWLEIYKDAKSDLTNLNPVTIEQKMAMIEVINGRLIPTVMNAEKNLTAEAQKLNLLKLKKLQTHMEGFDLSSKLSRDDLESFAADLMIILKGPPISLLDYFTTNKTKRMNERLMRMIQEDILVMGLKGMAERIPEKDAYTRLERGKYNIKTFFQKKFWKFFVMPYDLPWFEKVHIPEELLEKIMLDGLDAHNQELIAHLKKQGMIDHYERFRKVYRPIAFSLGFYFYYDKINNKMSGSLDANQEEEKKKLLEDFSQLAESIMQSDVGVKSEDMMKQEQFDRVLETFRSKYNEEPTKQEYEEMRARIFN